MDLKADFQCFGSYEIIKSGLDLGAWANPPPMFAPKTLTLIRCLINAPIENKNIPYISPSNTP